jgi:hypothetical protein
MSKSSLFESSLLRRGAAWALAGAVGLAAPAALAVDDFHHLFARNGNDRASIVAQIAHMPVTINEAITEVEKGGEKAIAAKFDVDMGAIYLHVYTTEQGLDVDPDQAVLKEYVARMKGDRPWLPDTKTLDDDVDVAEYHALLAKSPFSLGEITAKAEAEGGGKVMFVQPRVSDGKEVFQVGVAVQDYVRFLEYDLMQGELLGPDVALLP